MIDHDRRFIHVHIQRCAGTSIEQFFNYPHRYDHRTPQDYIRQYGRDVWDNYYKFSVIRNPWAKVVSHYFWRKQRAWWYSPGDELDFPSWVKNFNEFKDHLGDKNRPQIEWVALEGEWAMDEMVKLENLNRHWPRICDDIGVEYKPLPHSNETSHAHYSNYYDQETQDIVADWYKPDIETFNFEFEEKNGGNNS